MERGHGGARDLTAPLPSALALHPIRIAFLLILCESAVIILAEFFGVWYFKLIHILQLFLDFIIAKIKESRVDGADVAKSIEKCNDGKLVIVECERLEVGHLERQDDQQLQIHGCEGQECLLEAVTLLPQEHHALDCAVYLRLHHYVQGENCDYFC